MPHKTSYTHHVAVSAYILQENKFLLLQRNHPPYIWAPPGGRLRRNEDPLSGLQREVKEETNLDIQVIAPANTWFGLWRKDYYLLSIDYLVTLGGGELKLSPEHRDYAWVSLEELRRGEPIKLHPEIGFQLPDFQQARDLFDHFTRQR